MIDLQSGNLDVFSRAIWSSTPKVMVVPRPGRSGRLGATGGKVPQNLQPESPGQHPLDDSLGGLQLKALVALLALARTFGVELRMDDTFSLKPAPDHT